jgi:hypothetical protein
MISMRVPAIQLHSAFYLVIVALFGEASRAIAVAFQRPSEFSVVQPTQRP